MTSILPSTQFLVVDTETTGIDPATCRVVELAWVLADLEHVLTAGSTLVNPGCPIPPEASAVHHLVDEDVASAPTLGQAISQMGDGLRPWGGMAAFAAHNAAFDSAFLPSLQRVRPWVCTYRLARRLLPDAPAYGNQFLRYFLKLQVPEAQGLAAHRALADAYVTAALLRRLVPMALENAHGCLALEAFVHELDQPILLKTCGFGKHKGTAWAEVPRDYLQWMLGPKGMKDLDVDTRHTAEFYLKGGRR
jgi:exodeoxyribonuclease X